MGYINTVIDEAMENDHELAEEVGWRTEADVRTLVEARRIMGDAERLERAVEYLKAGLEQAQS